MLLDLIFSVFFGIFKALISILPNWTPPDVSGYIAQFTVIFRYLGWANYYFPIDIMLGLIAVRFVIWIDMYAYAAARAVLVKVHVLGGND